jgi:uncharacterized membrane protein YccC
MRIWPLILVVIVLLAAVAGFAAQARKGRRGERPSTAVVVALGVVLTFGIVALGGAIGYAARGTALAAAIGCGVAGGVLMIVGPLLRAWTSARLAERQSAASTRVSGSSPPR